MLTVLTPPFFLFLGHFITFLLYLYISSSVDKSDDSVDRVYRLDIVGVRGSDLKVLPEALDGALKRLLANWYRERGFPPPTEGVMPRLRRRRRRRKTDQRRRSKILFRNFRPEISYQDIQDAENSSRHVC